MNVTGPDWPSTAALRDALKGIPGPDVRWGGGKNGVEQLTLFRSAQIACPWFTRDLNTAKQWVRAGHRVFGRRLHHTQGTDIIGPGYKPGRASIGDTQALKWITTRKENRIQRPKLVRGSPGVAEKWNSEWSSRDFWVKVIDSVAEYRQHVWDGRAIRIGKKVEDGRHWRKQLVRSRANGWHIDYGFKPENATFTEAIRKIAKEAVASLSYQGGAVDILEGRDGQLYVLEVNSAPSLRDQNTLSAYVTAISRWAKREQKKSLTK